MGLSEYICYVMLDLRISCGHSIIWRREPALKFKVFIGAKYCEVWYRAKSCQNEVPDVYAPNNLPMGILKEAAPKTLKPVNVRQFVQ